MFACQIFLLINILLY